MSTENPAAASSEVVLFECVAEHIAVITLNRPDKRNAVNSELTQALSAAVKRVESDDSIWAAIITSSNDQVFCAGEDLNEVAAAGSAGLSTIDGGFAGFVRAERRKPWIAAANGSCVGGGLEILLACDLSVVGETATLGLPEVKRGLVAAAGGLMRLPRAIPRAVALEMIATGDPIPAEMARHFGLVNRMVPDSEVLKTAIELAGNICVNAPIAVRESLAVARQVFDHTELELWKLSQYTGRITAESEDFKEGPRAFLEKRTPVWSGK